MRLRIFIKVNGTHKSTSS